MSRLVAFGLIVTSCLPAPAANEPSAEDRAKLEQRAQALQTRIDDLRTEGTDEQSLADIAVCAKAAEWILRHSEWHKPDYAAKTAKTLDIGERRADLLKQDKADWDQQPGGVALGYVSQIDGSVQPYALTFPEGYSTKGSKRWPLYVVLHGRNGNLTEASFIAEFNGKKPSKNDYVQLDVYGRGNNAYRWAGETDVFEALDDARKRLRIDEQRVVLWGFSMGGAGAWHLGLHHPDRWAAAGAGAGFVDYYKYQKKTSKLPPHQDKPLAIYDSVNYALNAANVPFVTYGGDQDPQLLASTTMLEAADPLGVPIESIVGKNIGHKFTPEAEQVFQAFLAEHSKAGRPLPSQRESIRFTTSTLKYNRCGWVTIEAMDEMYFPATVEAEISDNGETAVVTTTNVAALRLVRDVANEVEIDGDRLPLRDAADGLLPDVWYLRDGEGWRMLNYDDSREYLSNAEVDKRHDLQGPIDDAFMQSFVVVKGTGTPWSDRHQKYADWSLARFEREFDKYLRGKIRVVPADEVTPEMIESQNLVLFGDPGSNALIAKVLPELPVEWTKETLNVAGKAYDPNSHAAVLVYPNPLNPHRYVVLNSGHTFHADAFEGTNALLYPRLGDIAVLKTTEDAKNGFMEETEWAELFDVNWELPRK
ncbi:MAG: alpha/beta hydrolase [Planctomycetota bacterium]|nr:alpha/beta hydrolase [Planctomycetaceae bacterium]MDQ3330601.1 alpha/beta hydrolase [Planctomycetota bacterium]